MTGLQSEYQSRLKFAVQDHLKSAHPDHNSISRKHLLYWHMKLKLNCMVTASRMIWNMDENRVVAVCCLRQHKHNRHKILYGSPRQTGRQLNPTQKPNPQSVVPLHLLYPMQSYTRTHTSTTLLSRFLSLVG